MTPTPTIGRKSNLSSTKPCTRSTTPTAPPSCSASSRTKACAKSAKASARPTVTARKRVNRAVERLREFFSKRGVAVGASGLVVVISANAVQAAPVGLAVTISTAAALAGTTILTTTTATVTKAIAMTTLQKTLITATFVVASVTTPLVIQHQAYLKLREENQSLRQGADELAQQLAESERRSPRRAFAPRLPAPRMQAATVPGELSAEEFRPLIWSPGSFNCAIETGSFVCAKESHRPS